MCCPAPRCVTASLPRVACPGLRTRPLAPNFRSGLVRTVSPGGVRTTSSIGNPNLKASTRTILTCSMSVAHPHRPAAGGCLLQALTDPIVPLNTVLSDGTIQTSRRTPEAPTCMASRLLQQHFNLSCPAGERAWPLGQHGYTASAVSLPNVLNPNGSPSASRAAISPTCCDRHRTPGTSAPL